MTVSRYPHQPLQLNEAAKRYWQEIAARRGAALDSAPVDEDEGLCPTCGGIGFVITTSYRDDKGGYHPGRPMSCPNRECRTAADAQRDRYARLSTASQIPTAYQHFRLDDWHRLAQTSPEYLAGKWDAYGAAYQFVQAGEREQYQFTLADAAAAVHLPAPDIPAAYLRRSSLVLSGINGVGKTSLAVSIANALLDAGRPVVYTRLAEVLDALRSRFGGGAKNDDLGDGEDDVMKTFQSAPVLVLDEFGLAQVTPWRRDRVEQLINYRYTHTLPTIITTNLDRDGLAEAWGLVTAHRIHAMAHWIEMSGMELRDRAQVFQSR